MTHLFKMTHYKDHCEKATSYSLSLFVGIHGPIRLRFDEMISLKSTDRVWIPAFQYDKSNIDFRPDHVDIDLLFFLNLSYELLVNHYR